MCKLVIKKPIKERSLGITKKMIIGVESLYHMTCRHRKTTVGVFLTVLFACLVIFMFWGTEFIPSMNEGAIYIRATLPNSINLTESVKLTQEMKAKVREFA